MNRRLLAATVAVGSFTLAACSSSTDDATASSTSASPSLSVPAVPSPNSVQTPDLLAGLRALHVPQADNGEKIISRSRNECLSIKQGITGSALIEQTRQRFTDKMGQPLSADLAAKVVEVVRSSFCK